MLRGFGRRRHVVHVPLYSFSTPKHSPLSGTPAAIVWDERGWASPASAGARGKRFYCRRSPPLTVGWDPGPRTRDPGKPWPCHQPKVCLGEVESRVCRLACFSLSHPLPTRTHTSTPTRYPVFRNIPTHPLWPRSRSVSTRQPPAKCDSRPPELWPRWYRLFYSIVLSTSWEFFFPGGCWSFFLNFPDSLIHGLPNFSPIPFHILFNSYHSFLISIYLHISFFLFFSSSYISFSWKILRTTAMCFTARIAICPDPFPPPHTFHPASTLFIPLFSFPLILGETFWFILGARSFRSRDFFACFYQRWDVCGTGSQLLNIVFIHIFFFFFTFIPPPYSVFFSKQYTRLIYIFFVPQILVH